MFYKIWDWVMCNWYVEPKTLLYLTDTIKQLDDSVSLQWRNSSWLSFLLRYGIPIPVVEIQNFSAYLRSQTIFDRKLSFISAINLLRVVAHTSWGAYQQTLLHLYRSLIISKLDYDCVVYGSARPSYLNPYRITLYACVWELSGPLPLAVCDVTPEKSYVLHFF